MGADPQVHGLRAHYTNQHEFHEPFVLFGYLAAVTRLDLMTGILVLPQRQTVLVAKQAVEVDRLSGGRLRLGVGLGWNPVEYEALGMEFGDRGKRSEEQIAVLRKLWSEHTFTFTGQQHTITAASMLPHPVRGSIPIWIGTGKAEVALRRVARLADGWFPNKMRWETFDSSWAHLKSFLEKGGRDPAQLGLQGLVHDCRTAELGRIAEDVDRWRDAGATHVAFQTSWSALASLDQHLECLELIADRLSIGDRARTGGGEPRP
jgi:probable F420-dependent oxidoreductase